MARSARRVGKGGSSPNAAAFCRSAACGTLPAMKAERSIFDDTDDAADEAATLEGEADLAAGRVISHEAMKAWLLSWGTADELPPPQAGD